MRIFEEIVNAVNFIHSSGFFHRDIKTDNIVLTKDKIGVIHPLIIDFGLALPIQKQATGLYEEIAHSDTNSGSPLY